MQPIQKGSFIFTDAFAGAMSFASDEQKLSKIVPIQLPIWSKRSGLFISPGDLGLSNGVVDPNLLFAECLSRHWLNMLRHINKMNADNGLEQFHGFAEQAFWKTCERLSSDDVSPMTWVRSVSKQVSQKNALAEDILTKQLTFHIATTDRQVQARAVVERPDWLVVDSLPQTDMDTVLHGDNLALYDKQSNRYNLDDEHCIVAKLSEIESLSFKFNALLVYFKDENDVEDLGGIFFVDKFEQNGDFWEIKSLSKNESSTYTYVVNLVSNGAKFIQFHAKNSSLPAALSIYDEMLRLAQREHILLMNLNDRVQSLEQSLNTVMSLLSNEQLATLHEKLDRTNTLALSQMSGQSLATLLGNLLNNGTTKYIAKVQIDQPDTLKTHKELTSSDETFPAGTSVTTVLEHILRKL